MQDARFVLRACKGAASTRWRCPAASAPCPPAGSPPAAPARARRSSRSRSPRPRSLRRRGSAVCARPTSTLSTRGCARGMSSTSMHSSTPHPTASATTRRWCSFAASASVAPRARGLNATIGLRRQGEKNSVLCAIAEAAEGLTIAAARGRTARQPRAPGPPQARTPPAAAPRARTCRARPCRNGS